LSFWKCFSRAWRNDHHHLGFLEKSFFLITTVFGIWLFPSFIFKKRSSQKTVRRENDLFFLQKCEWDNFLQSHKRMKMTSGSSVPPSSHTKNYGSLSFNLTTRNIAFETGRICIVKNAGYWLDEQTKLRTNIVVNHTMNIIYSFWHENSKSHGCTVDHKNASSFDFCVTVCWDCSLGGRGGQAILISWKNLDREFHAKFHCPSFKSMEWHENKYLIKPISMTSEVIWGFPRSHSPSEVKIRKRIGFCTCSLRGAQTSYKIEATCKVSFILALN